MSLFELIRKLEEIGMKDIPVLVLTSSMEYETIAKFRKAVVDGKETFIIETEWDH